MEKKNALYLAAAFATAASFAGEINAAPPGKEKCYGAALKGKNDCGAKDKSHSCAGQAKDNCSDNEWKYVKKGTCHKARKNCKSEANLGKEYKRNDHDKDQDGAAGALSGSHVEKKPWKKDYSYDKDYGYDKVKPESMKNHDSAAKIK